MIATIRDALAFEIPFITGLIWIAHRYGKPGRNKKPTNNRKGKTNQ